MYSSNVEKHEQKFWSRNRLGCPGGSVGKESTCNAGDTGDVPSTPGSGRSPGVGHSNPLQYFCLGNPMDRTAWQATDHGVAKSQTRLSTYSHIIDHFQSDQRTETSELICPMKQELRVLRKRWTNPWKRSWGLMATSPEGPPSLLVQV